MKKLYVYHQGLSRESTLLDLNDIKRISGVFNIYFPFELKNTMGLKEICRMYNRRRNMQIKELHINQSPRTDLMDRKNIRKEIEDILSVGQKLMCGKCDGNNAPYANENIARAYHQAREDNLFAKEASVILSEFTAEIEGVNNILKPIRGSLFYFNNLGNCVGTYVLALRFNNLTIDEAIRLKHVFYKRSLAHIKECHGLVSEESGEEMTFQEYICKWAQNQKQRRKTDIDCRARYTFMEIDLINMNYLSDEEKYGLLTSNEKYSTVKVAKEALKDNSKERSYALYYDLRSALILNYKKYYDTTKQQESFFSQLKIFRDFIDIEFPQQDMLIAGLDKGKFPQYLKSVELHLLTNNAQRHETVRHELSYWNPYIFLRRRYRIWKILNELDISHCYINGSMLKSFGVEDNLNNLKDEYSQLNSHIMNYSILMVSIVAVLIAIFKP